MDRSDATVCFSKKAGVQQGELLGRTASMDGRLISETLESKLSIALSKARKKGKEASKRRHRHFCKLQEMKGRFLPAARGLNARGAMTEIISKPRRQPHRQDDIHESERCSDAVHRFIWLLASLREPRARPYFPHRRR